MSVAHTSDKTDSYIAMVLSMSGRVRPADLQMVAEDARSEALQAYFERHREVADLHFSGDELVAGTEPTQASAAASPTSAPAAHRASEVAAPSPESAPVTPTDLTESGESAIDLLLGDFDGSAERAVEFASPPTSREPVATSAATRSAAPAPAAKKVPQAKGRLWMLWWIPTVLVPLLGGLGAWFFLRERRPVQARIMLGVGIGLGMLGSIMFLRYAEQIATLTMRATAPSVIELPSTPPPSSASSAPAPGESSGTSSARE